jgi:hypothetical protein
MEIKPQPHVVIESLSIRDKNKQVTIKKPTLLSKYQKKKKN